MFSRTVSSSTSPSVRRFSGQNATFLVGRRARAAHRDRRAVEVELPGVGPVGAEQEARELGAAGPEQAGEADDLSRAEREVERRDRVLARHRPWPRARASSPRARRPRAASCRSSASSVWSSRPSMFETSSARGSSAVGHSPTSCPLRSTVIRSAISYTCSRKCEMKTIAMPSLLQPPHQRRRAAPPRAGRGSTWARRGSAPGRRCRSPGRSRPSAARRASSRRAGPRRRRRG